MKRLSFFWPLLFLLFLGLTSTSSLAQKSNKPCPAPTGGDRKPPPLPPFGPGWWFWLIMPMDPNEIIGPEGQPDKRWVSVRDRLPYTILCENDKSASAPAKYIRISTPIEPKQDAKTFQLGSFGFNNLNFQVPEGLASYYTRLDVRDSLGLYVDVVAGYDQLRNEAFWEFQSIDPVTLLPTEEPLKGLLLLQDSTRPDYGHGFVTYSIKPVETAVTGDTIGARAKIVFDGNDTIPTNIYTNTIDAFAPGSSLNEPSFANGAVTLRWGGIDDPGGSGLRHYDLYVSSDGSNFSLLRGALTRTDTTIALAGGLYHFFVLATDSVGNTEVLRPGAVKTVFVSGTTLPVNWLTFSGKNVAKDNLLEWSTASEQNSKEFKVQRSLNGTGFTTIGTVAAAGNSSSARSYQYTDKNIDRLNSAVMYYRLQQVDRDGKATLSNVVRLTYQGASKQPSIVYPNPTRGAITISIGDRTLLNTNANVFDQSGKLLQVVRINSQSQAVDLSRYVSGTYYIRLQNKEVLKIVKQ